MAGPICDTIEVEAGSSDAEPLAGGRSGSADRISDLPFTAHPESPDALPKTGPYVWHETAFDEYVVEAGGRWFHAYRCEPN